MRKCRVVLAHSFAITTSLSAIVSACYVIAVTVPSCVVLAEASVLAWLLLAVVTASVLGWICGAIFLWPLVGRIARRLNGHPFCVGDSIRILTGPHRGRRAVVYELWEERGQMRVDIGPEAKRSVTDVFNGVEVYKEMAEPGATDNPGDAKRLREDH